MRLLALCLLVVPASFVAGGNLGGNVVIRLMESTTAGADPRAKHQFDRTPQGITLTFPRWWVR